MRTRPWCALAVFALVAFAQLAGAQTPGQSEAAARQLPVDAAFRADIEKLMAISGATELGVQMASQMSEAILNSFKQSGAAVPPRAIDIVQEVLVAEFSKAFAGPEIKDKQIAIYAKYFTHADIKGLIAFYETDLGRKAIANLPSLMREGGQVGEQWAQGAMPQILETLKARLKSEGFIP